MSWVIVDKASENVPIKYNCCATYACLYFMKMGEGVIYILILCFGEEQAWAELCQAQVSYASYLLASACLAYAS